MRHSMIGRAVVLGLMPLMLLVGNSDVSQAQTLEWIDQFGTSGSDLAFGVSSDGLGNVYVAGNTGINRDEFAEPLGAESFGHVDAFLRKYTASGAELWTEQIGTHGEFSYDSARDVAADSLGNVFVTGHTFGENLGDFDFPESESANAFVMKYDSSGVLNWTVPISSFWSDRGNGVAVDRMGNVIVTGRTHTDQDARDRGDSTVFVHKYDVDGTLLWNELIETPENDFNDTAGDVALDSQGNVYIAGSFGGDVTADESDDGFLAKISADGVREWTQRYGTADHDVVQDIAVDAGGNIYVTGNSGYRTEIADREALLWKFDDQGTLQWGKDVGISGQDGNRGSALDTDDFGNVYLGGMYHRGADTGGNDAFVRMLDEDGNVLWTHEFVTEENEFVQSIDFQAPSTLFVVGYTSGVFSGTPAGGFDAFVAKFRIDRLFDPGAGDFDGDGVLAANDIDLLSHHVREVGQVAAFDLNSDGLVNDVDRTLWVESFSLTYFGDSNLDGEFNSSDLVSAFQVGEYEDNVASNSGWADGDWNGDGEFSTSDLVLAFQRGGFEQGPRAAVSAVPEPTSASLLLFTLMLLVTRMRRCVSKDSDVCFLLTHGCRCLKA